MGYKPQQVDVIEFIHTIEKWKTLAEEPREDRIRSHVKAGNEFRKITGRRDAVAVYAIADIRERLRGGKASKAKADEPIPNNAYIIRSLKHPDEVATLREIYGSAFFLIGAYSDRDVRINKLAHDIADSHHVQATSKHRAIAEELSSIDEHEAEEEYGQRIRDTFPLADVFLDTTHPETMEKELKRFVQVLFGHPFHTPTPNENAMFLAQAAALRSADLSRQVGAAIATKEGDIIAVGTNEVPKAGGGLYWSTDSPDHRNFTKGEDTSDTWRRHIVAEILGHLKKDGWLNDAKKSEHKDKLLNDATGLLKTAQVMRLNEFGRAVHAEMAALMDAARRGVAVKGHILFTTTFPCHECARHIVAAGIEEVYFITPYPKSYAKELHLDAIYLDGKRADEKQVEFRTFVGISPRRYMEFFQLGERKRKENGKAVVWNPSKAQFRFPSLPAAYIRNEKDELKDLDDLMKAKGLEVVPEEPAA